MTAKHRMNHGVTFEFGFGHYVAREPWAKLLADYDVRRGRIWRVVPLWLALGAAGDLDAASEIRRNHGAA